MKTKFISIVAAVLATSLASTAYAQRSEATPKNPVVAACEGLESFGKAARFAEIPYAPAAIHLAKIVPADGNGTEIEKGLPEHCRVDGQIAPNIGFLLRMPTKDWNGKFMMGGCGGPCGNYLTDRIDTALWRNYAVVVTDMGHRGNGWSFGMSNLQGMVDFGSRSTHVTAVVAKEVIKEFYGKAAAKNYFWGCSTGGRQALISAQRFPKDFDGIVGGAPPFNQTGHQALMVEYTQKANTASDGSAILKPEKLPMIHNAVLAACDELDGLKDGVLQHPPACKWEPKQIQCSGDASGPNCLTAAEVGVVEKIYNGAQWDDGRPMYYGQSGRARGTELKWTGDLRPLRSGKGNSMRKYFDVFYAKGPAYDDLKFDMKQDLPELAMTEWIFSPMNPDMRNFKAEGGKFIYFTGWDDGCCRGDATIDNYEMITRVMGGPEETNDFMRLFLPAGMDHCRYGIGGGEIDWITYIENWVEKGQAPEEVIAHHMVKEPYPSVERPINDPAERLVLMGRHPLPKGSFDRAHPVYPYPDWPRYSGKGDATKPETWERVTGKYIMLE